MQKHEEWRPVAGYEGIYEVSSLGRVRSLDRKDYAGRKRKGRILRPGTQGGYLFVGICKDGIQSVKRVHALVAEAFIGPKTPELECNHIDGNKENNSATNLEYVTHGENIRHASSMGLMGNLSVEQVQAIRHIYRVCPQMRRAKIAERLEIGRITVDSILSGRAYGNVPNEDGTPYEPIERPKLIETINAMTVLGFTLPEIAITLGLDNSTPYRAIYREKLRMQSELSAT